METAGQDDVAVCLTANNGAGITLTRAADGIYESTTGFHGGEQVKVYMENGGTTASATYDVGKPHTDGSSQVMVSDLTPATGETALRYPSGASGSVNLYAVYPAASTASHTVSHDQSDEENYQTSDLMLGTPVDGSGNIAAVSWSTLAEKTALATTNIPNLVFSHQMVKLRVVLIKAADVSQVSQVRMLNVKRQVSVTPSATGLTLGAPATASDGQGDELVISGAETAATDESKTYIYCCVFPAQTWNDGGSAKDFLAVTADGYTTTFRLKRDSWTTGNEYTLTINLNELALGSTIDIGEWGDATLETTPTVTGGALKMEDLEDVTYRGTAFTPTPDITYKGTPLTASTDFTYSYFGNTNAGTAMVLVTGAAGTAYDGKIGFGQFTISPRSLDTYKSQFTITASNPVYNATEQTNTFTVVDNGLATGTDYTMIANTDYTISGTMSATDVAATDYTVTITGQGNYCDSKTVTWNIAKRPVNLTAVDGEIDKGDEETYGTSSTGKEFKNLDNTSSSDSYYAKYVKADATTTTSGLVSGHYVSQVTIKPSTTSEATTSGTLTPSAATIKNASGTDVTSNYDITYTAGTLVVNKTNDVGWVDLGLDSGTLWARTNVGAEYETDYGDYFAWGETTGHPSGESYSFGSSSYTYKENPATLPGEHDAAVQSSDYSDGRIPTADEMRELVNTKNDTSNYTWEWKTNYNDCDINGWLITSKKSETSGNYIFLPAAGYRSYNSTYVQGTYCFYWSSSRYDSDFAYYLNSKSTFASVGYANGYYRYNGFTVRAVK